MANFNYHSFCGKYVHVSTDKMKIILSLAITSLYRQDVHLARVQCPVLLLHAEDDPKTPLALASTLLDTVKAAGKTDVELEVENNS